MKEEIVNRVAKSKLLTIDLEAFYPEGKRYSLDISQWLMEGIVLRESDFRQAVKDHDWNAYHDGYLSVYCSTDAIVPAWAYLLVSVTAAPFVRKVVVGRSDVLETLLYTEVIDNMDLSPYIDKPVIIKGCAHKPVPQNAFAYLSQKLQPLAKSIMYGEACSAVPLFKKKR